MVAAARAAEESPGTTGHDGSVGCKTAQGAMVWPAPLPGRSLEAGGNSRSREMTVHDRTRLTSLLGHPVRLSPILT
jgi:hypothetical protein